MDFETLDRKLAQLGVTRYGRPSSSSSDRHVSYGHDLLPDQHPEGQDNPGDITSQSLPDDLSMGTQDFISNGGYINRRRGAPSNEASFLRRALSSTTTNQVLPSSPPVYSNAAMAPIAEQTIHTDSLLDDSVVHHEHDERPRSSGSAASLTESQVSQTNNKLMNLLGRFDEFGHSQDELPFTSDGNELPIGRFGEGDVSKYDFDFEKHVSPADTRVPSHQPEKIFVNQAEPDLERPAASSNPARQLDVAQDQEPSPLRSPKRRRTLLKSEIVVDNQQLEVQVAQVQEVVPLAGSKRKDARPGDAGLQASADVLAKRALLQPRGGRKLSVHGLGFALSQNSEADPGMAEVLAAELASFAHDAADYQMDSRKPSLATKDYMEEANKVMELIRARGKPKLASIDEPEDASELDPDKILDLELDNESTKDAFSRPPSREGNYRTSPQQCHPRHAVHDAETANYLRQYQEDDDLELLANTSGLGTIRTVDNRAAEEASHVPIPEESASDDQESSPPNVRILNPDQSVGKRKHSASTTEGWQEGSVDRQLESQGSDTTRRTFPTSSSTGNKGVITNGSIPIPDQVGTMTFDHQRKIWVQSSSLRSQSKALRKSRLSINDEDPFANIPDLSIEEQTQDPPKHRPLTQLLQGAIEPQATDFDGIELPQTKSSDPTSTTQSADAQYRDDQAHTNSSLRSQISRHEAMLHDGVASEEPSPISPARKQARAVTIAFSSPLVSAIKYPDEPYISDEDLLDEDVELPLDDSEESLLRSARKPKAKPPQEPPADIRRDERYNQYRAMTMNRRPVSRIDERAEDDAPVEMSLVHVKGSQELTPRPRQYSMVKFGSNNRHNSSILCLTPLSEFSLHQIDQGKHPEESFVEERRNPKTLRQAHGSQALSVDALVKAITDAAGGEIYWDHLRSLDLDGRGVSSLHGLEEYCPVLEELSASKNQIPHLNGLPPSLRVLDFQQNALTSLTSWTSLSNLQYVDVSNNQLENLDGFSCLVHLRRLVANNNQIKNLDGILDLNGLLELDVSGNEISELDFQASELLRLNKLNLSHNKIETVSTLDQLRSLEEINLSGNKISSFDNVILPASVRVLELADNTLETFGFSSRALLKSVNLDGNKVTSVSGLESAKALDYLSLRGQRAVSELVSNVLSASSECTRINLSSNVVRGGCFELPKMPQWSLRSLELSGCGISELPAGFGNMFPNCRQLNLNFNGISDLSTLRGMHKLSELQIARNRIKRMRRTCLVLSRFRMLTKLDMRDNPLTTGFYSPQQPGKDAALGRPEEHYDFLQRNADSDAAWMVLLDETTKLKRRTIELLLAEACPMLNMLDGCGFRTEFDAKSDQTWDALTEKGVLVIPTLAEAQNLTSPPGLSAAEMEAGSAVVHEERSMNWE
jgi:protein NUD1